MKKLFALALLMGFAATAQDFYGVATYTSFTTFKDMNIKVEGDPALEALMKERFSKGMEREYTLKFNRFEAVYEQVEKLEPAGPAGARSMRIGDGKKYTNLKDKSVIEERDIMDKEFIVTDSIRKFDWKLENETKKIGDYTCYKATHTIKITPPTEEEKKELQEKSGGTDLLSMIPKKDIVITAWYTPEIPVSHGPDEYWGLPGLILEVQTQRTTMLCSKLALNPKEKPEIKAPHKGEKVTQEEYMEIMTKKMEEMQETMPARGKGKGGISITFGE